MNEIDYPKRHVRKRAFQFRVATLLLVMIVVASFFAGRYTAQSRNNQISNAALTATWNPGNSVPLAMFGPIDIDGDGSDDFAMIKKLISDNGGTVVASRDSIGSVSGRIDATTRYLIVEDPSDPTIKSNKLVMDANKHSVPLISAAKLLKRMGVQANKTANGFQTRKKN